MKKALPKTGIKYFDFIFPKRVEITKKILEKRLEPLLVYYEVQRPEDDDFHEKDELVLYFTVSGDTKVDRLSLLVKAGNYSSDQEIEKVLETLCEEVIKAFEKAMVLRGINSMNQI